MNRRTLIGLSLVGLGTAALVGSVATGGAPSKVFEIAVAVDILAGGLLLAMESEHPHRRLSR
jgi:hypothetical protein